MAGYIGKDSSGILLAESDPNAVPKTGGSFTGAVTGTDLTLSGGVYLGGTGSANYLDDYEEGTWTPTLTYGSANFNYATYTKIGRFVFASFSCNDATDYTTNQSVQFSLPFAAKTNTIGGGSVFIRYLSTSAAQITPYVYSSVDIQLYTSDFSGSNWSALKYSDFTRGDWDAYITVIYETT